MPKVGQIRRLTEKHLQCMRVVRDRSDRFFDEHRFLSTKTNGATLSLGSSHFDPFLYGEVLAELLRWFGKGYSLTESSKRATEYGYEIVSKWNAAPQGISINGNYELQRDKCAAESIILWAVTVLRDSEV